MEKSTAIAIGQIVGAALFVAGNIAAVKIIERREKKAAAQAQTAK